MYSTTSPYINHFIQPDTVIPNPSDPQSLNRFSYVQNNPIRYNDPSGHRACEGSGSVCDPVTHADEISNLKLIIKDYFKWNIKGNDWKLKELETIYQTGNDILDYANGVTGGNGLDWMHYAFGNTTIVHGNNSDSYSDAMPFLGDNFGSRIRLGKGWLNSNWTPQEILSHELGHVWDITSRFSHSGKLNKTLGGSSWCFFCDPGNDVPQWDPRYHPSNGDAYGNSSRNEYFAEAFSATVYNPGIVPAGASEWIRLQIIKDVMRYLFPGGLQ